MTCPRPRAAAGEASLSGERRRRRGLSPARRRRRRASVARARPPRRRRLVGEVELACCLGEQILQHALALVTAGVGCLVLLKELPQALHRPRLRRAEESGVYAAAAALGAAPAPPQRPAAGDESARKITHKKNAQKERARSMRDTEHKQHTSGDRVATVRTALVRGCAGYRMHRSYGSHQSLQATTAVALTQCRWTDSRHRRLAPWVACGET